MNKSHIENKAGEILIETKDNNKAAVDIINISRELGFVVCNAELRDDEDGFIIVDERKREILGQQTSRLIGVRRDRSVEWKRFIIAHEIGHYVLHYDKIASNGMYAHRDHKKGKNEMENEADYFAANLLMPADRFKRNYQDLKEIGLSFEEKVMILAKRFCVTEAMTKRRFKELELNE